MIDLYKILDLDYKVSSRRIFKRFVEYSKKYHPDFDTSDIARQKFIDINIAYYILEYNAYRKQYNRLYEKDVLRATNTINNQPDLEKKLVKWIEDGKMKAHEYFKMPYRKFYKKIPKNENVFESIILQILDFI